MKQRILFIIFMSFLFIRLYADELKFLNLNDAYGISVSAASPSCKDADGFIWIATKKGIVRLTDSDSRVYQLPYESAAAPSVEMSWQENQLFAVTNQDEIFRYNPALDKFERCVNFHRQTNTSGLYYYKDDQYTKVTQVQESASNTIPHNGSNLSAAGPYLIEDSINSITLDNKQSNVTIHLLTLGNDSCTARFSWKMQRIDNDWNAPTDQSVINYTNLNPGTYKLSIRVYNYNLVSERTLTIRIIPPFWVAWWFRLTYTLLASWLVFFLARVYINRLNQRHAEDKLRFFTNIAHDLRTALTLIKAPIQELNNTNDLSEHDREYLQLATEQTQRLTSVATQLLNFQKVDTGKEQFQPVITDIVALIGCRVSMFEAMASARHIKIAYYPDRDIYLTAIDTAMMERVIDNLLSNAVKYSYKQSTVEVYFYGDENTWRMKVVDYGIGISHKAQSKLFHEFYRTENAVNAKIAGSGIGLFMTKMLVKLHGGKISMQSKEGKGSTLEIIVPRRTADAQENTGEQAVVSSDDQADNYVSEDMRILIVEDNDDLRNFMIRPLRKHFRVATAADGVEAWEYIRQEIPDLIVSDIMMPRMDGLELCRLVKSTSETSHIPIILLTVLSEKAEELCGLELGADDYVTKPFDMKMLTQRITSIIRNRRIIGARFIAPDSIADANNKPNEPVNLLNDAFVKRAMGVVMRHLDDTNFGKDDFAKEMGISTSLLFKKMKALTDMSVVDFIRVVRMEHAMKLLQEKQYSIGEIAYKCGFSTVNYFSTTFKKHFGKSPTDFIL